MDRAKKEEISNFAENKNYEILSIMGDSIDEKSQILTVIQFVQAIDRAELVVTDSFHGAVFSIILNTPFQVLERRTGNMNSRLETLLEKFKLTKNLDREGLSFDDILNTDFTETDSVLSSERKQSKEYLDCFLDNRVTSNE